MANPIILPDIVNMTKLKSGNDVERYNRKAKEIIDYELLVEDDRAYLKTKECSILLVHQNRGSHIYSTQYAIKISRKFSVKQWKQGKIRLERWLRHPDFKEVTPESIRQSWVDQFLFKKEDKIKGIEGLRIPQIGGLHSILGHISNATERGIVVMPTGTGKTETMLSFVIASACEKILITVPSTILRDQIGDKFLKLGLLKTLGVVPESVELPLVCKLTSSISTIEEAQELISSSNIVVSTMQMISQFSEEIRSKFANGFSYLLVDEAHHSKANTWSSFIELFSQSKVLLFTATPYRHDGKKLEGRFIYNFTLKQAQDQGYYKSIKFLPVREYNQERADLEIAKKAVDQLRKDISDGFDHLLLARCSTKKRADAVFKIYESHKDLNPIVVYNGVPKITEKITAIKNKQHKIIVCVDMFGEGFDLPELKIAAVHDNRQSIPITLQFIGRFTRTDRDNKLGTASLITNRAYPPKNNELEKLYAQDPDWNYLLPNVNEKLTNREIDFQSYLSNFRNIEESIIPFSAIQFPLSALFYKYSGNSWNPNQWEKGIRGIDSYEHKFSTSSSDSLIIVLGKASKVQWGNFDIVSELSWDIIVVYWSQSPKFNMITLYSSLTSFNPKALLEAIFNDRMKQLKGDQMFKVFHEIQRLRLFNVGAKKGLSKDISFQSYYGKEVGTGLGEIERGTIQKNNIFGVGYKRGDKVTLGCSAKGRVWSWMRGNLLQWSNWCNEMSAYLSDGTINPNNILKGTIIPEVLDNIPSAIPVGIDWNEELYKVDDHRHEFKVDNSVFDLSDLELSIKTKTYLGILFEIHCGEGISSEYLYSINSNGFEIKQVSGNEILFSSKSIVSYLNEYTPSIWFNDNSLLFENKPRIYEA